MNKRLRILTQCFVIDENGKETPNGSWEFYKDIPTPTQAIKPVPTKQTATLQPVGSLSVAASDVKG